MTEGGALQTVFDKAYFGKIFHVKVPREKKKQKEMHIITSWFYLDIYSDNFGRRLHHIAVRSIDSVGVKNDVITIHVKEKEPLKFECDNMEELKAAITPVDFKREVRVSLVTLSTKSSSLPRSSSTSSCTTEALRTRICLRQCLIFSRAFSN